MAAGADKRGISHDESISLLAAACQQGDYTRLSVAAQPPFGRWVPASEFKALLRPERPLCLATIARDLAREDIHPPLYFWLLHVWTLSLGVGVWTGLSLNIILAALTGLALFGLGRRVLGDDLQAAGVAAVWSFSPAALRVFAEARQYELLALLAVLFVWQCLRFADGRAPRRDAALLALLAAAGALTQFLFALVAAAGAALMVARLWPARRRLAAWGVASVAAGYALFSLVHPGFVLSLRQGQAQGTEFAVDHLVVRAERTVDTLAEFLLVPALAHGWAAYAAAGLLAALTFIAALRGRGLGPARRRRDAEARGTDTAEPGASPGRRLPPVTMPLVFAWLAATHAALFLSFESPGSAMDFKHLGAVWPFAAFVPVIALGAFPRRTREALAAAGGAALATGGTIAVLGHFPELGPEPSLERADAVLLDNVARGVLPRFVWRLDDDTRVFAADQRHLLARPEAWLSGLHRGDIWVGGLPTSDPRYGNSSEQGWRIYSALADRHRLRRLSDPLEPLGAISLGEDPRSPAAEAGRRGSAGM